jgi:predicted polyphosphate/ATP-dependent NAD kinase
MIVALLGDQRSIFGRGNQQTGIKVIERVGKNETTVVSTTGKIRRLAEGPSWWTPEPGVWQKTGGNRDCQ